MFNALDGGNEHAADTERTRAVRLLTEAKEMFQQIAAKVGDRPLLLDPSTDEEKLVVFQFRAALDRRKLQFPRTERELAALAVTPRTGQVRVLSFCLRLNCCMWGI